MPAKHGSKVAEKRKVKELEDMGYTVIPENAIRCVECGKAYSVDQNNTWQSSSPIHAGNTALTKIGTGKGSAREVRSHIPYCKSCLMKNFDIKDMNKVMALFFRMDIPFKQTTWDSVIEKWDGKSEEGAIGRYKTAVQLSFPDSRFIDSDEISIESNDDVVDFSNRKLSKSKLKELVALFGEGFTEKLYKEFDKKYNFLKNNYDEKTAMHTEALMKYVKYSVLEEQALVDGDEKKAKAWGEQANKAATAAKINPSQLSKADLSEGLSTLAELSLAVEKAVDVIPILPQFKYRPNDALDFNIFCYVNYERHLRGMPLVEYSDVYKFYDERIEEYIEQYGDPYGIFEEDPTKNNREKVEKFIPIEDGE